MPSARDRVRPRAAAHARPHRALRHLGLLAGGRGRDRHAADAPRAEAQLAQLHTDADRLTTLHDALAAADARAALRRARRRQRRRRAARSSTREARRATLANVALPAAGTYAVEGPNGVGKSTLFSLLRACARRKAPPPTLNFTGSTFCGCRRRVTAAASLSCRKRPTARCTRGRSSGSRRASPSRAAPRRRDGGGAGGALPRAGERAAAGARRQGGGARRVAPRRAGRLLRRAERRAARETALIRAVLLRSTCPPLLLLDESLAPLDPASSSS